MNAARRRTNRASSTGRDRPRQTTSPTKWAPARLRIIGGDMRGRRFQYSGDPRVRPMKDRVREALFNLVGPAIKGMHALDLFGGTGAVAFEAISRGALHATLVERHYPTLRVIRDNVQLLGIPERVTLVQADAFAWAATWQGPRDTPWAVFCCPPYRLFQEQSAALRQLLQDLHDRAPPDSVIAVEADRFDCFAELPEPDRWDVRRYAPAVLGILRLPAKSTA